MREGIVERSGGSPTEDPVHVRVVDLHKRYGDHEVLCGVTFDVYRGCNNMILGESGSGKTVLLRQLLRLEHPDRGQILVDGEDIVALDEVALGRVRAKFGVVFQDSALFDSMSVFDNVAFPLREHEPELSRSALRGRVEECLRSLDVLDAVEKLPGELSGGMKRRVAVARAMVRNPRIVVYDEPTRGLDPMLARSVDELVESTRLRFGVTSIVISHDMKSVTSIAQYVSLLRDGRMAFSGSLAEFLHADNPYAHGFLAASGVRLPKGLAPAEPAVVRPARRAAITLADVGATLAKGSARASALDGAERDGRT